MRRRKSFLLTVIPAEEPNQAFCGSVKSIDTGDAYTFSNIEEFRQVLMRELTAGHTKPLNQAAAKQLPDLTTG